MAYQSKYKGMEVEAILDGVSGKADKLKRVEWSGMRVKNPSVVNASITQNYIVILAETDAGDMYFAAKSGTTYYKNWPEREQYQQVTPGGLAERITFIKDVLYVSNNDVMVSSADGRTLLNVSPGVNAFMWVFQNLDYLTVRSTPDTIEKALGAKVSDFNMLAKNHLFVDRLSTPSEVAKYNSCTVEVSIPLKQLSVSIDKIDSRKNIIICYYDNGDMYVKSVQTVNMKAPVNNLDSTSTTEALSANMGRDLASKLKNLSSDIRAFDVLWDMVFEQTCVPIRDLGEEESLPSGSQIKTGYMAIYWIRRNRAHNGEVSTPVIGRYQEGLSCTDAPVIMGDGTRLRVTVGSMNNPGKGFRVHNSQGTDVTSNYRLWGLMFGTRF